MKFKKKGKVIHSDGTLIVNYHGIFFLMTRHGEYIPWEKTIYCGELMTNQFWLRTRKKLHKKGMPAVDLTNYHGEKAYKIAEALKKDKFYGLTATQKRQAVINNDISFKAKLRDTAAKKSLLRKKFEREVDEKEAVQNLKKNEQAKVILFSRAQFKLGNVPGFEMLKERSFSN